MWLSKRLQFTVMSLSHVGKLGNVDRGNEFWALLTDFSKAFDCIDQILPMAKLYCYGVSPEAANITFCLHENLNALHQS